jgi:cation transport regulator ChaC
MAYRVDSAAWPAIEAALDHREKAGYEHVRCALHLADGRAVDGLVYIAGPTNPNFVGPAPMAEMAAQIRRCVGPSGPNIEYLQRLQQALVDMGAEDVHVAALAQAAEEPQAPAPTRQPVLVDNPGKA